MKKVNIARIERKEFTTKNPIRIASNIWNAIKLIESTKIADPIAYVIMDESDLEAIFKESQMEGKFYFDLMKIITGLAEVVRTSADAETFSNMLSESISELFGFIDEDAKKRVFINEDPKSDSDNAGKPRAIRRGNGRGKPLADKLPNIVKFSPSDNEPDPEVS